MVVPVSVIVVTKNEEDKIAACLSCLSQSDDVWVVDSNSQDRTAQIVNSFANCRFVNFIWNGQYPKKRQWCLDTLPLKYDWVFFVDADEIVLPDMWSEIEDVTKSSNHVAGFFIKSRYRIGQKILRFGFTNNKIALFHKSRMKFPVVDDLDIPGMGEIEGHYQPVMMDKGAGYKIASLKGYMIHDALEDEARWVVRHEKYARWEAGMNRKNAWPTDPVPWRQTLKTHLRQSSLRPSLVFWAGFVGKLGILDGGEGLDFCRKKAFYYECIKKFAKLPNL